jgi:LysR family hydrogen peroxide-inducible transcriptional activator
MSTLDVSLRQLEYIVSVAEQKGFRRAADACGVAQPSLSMQVALAERQLGVQIFERDPRAVRVSSAGVAIVAQARRVLLAAHELRELARQSADPFRGTLRLGVIPTIGPYLLPEITPALAKAFPHLRLLWTEARTGDLVHELKDGRLDGVLLALEAGFTDLDYEVLGRDVFVLAASSRHPLVKPSSPTAPEVLKGETVLLLDDGHCFRDQALSFCAQAGAGEHSFRATSMATLVQMVSAGTAVTLLPSLALLVENRRSQLRVRRFTSPEPGRTLALAWRRGSALRQPLIALAETIRAIVPPLAPRKRVRGKRTSNRAVRTGTAGR